MGDFYKEVYGKGDPAPEGPHGWIQWKGTNVCMDIYCSCGAHLHADEDFFYFFECPHCKTVYAVGQRIKLLPLTDDQLKSDWMAGRTIAKLDKDDDLKEERK